MSAVRSAEQVQPETVEINFSVCSSPEDIKEYLKTMVKSKFCGDEDCDRVGLIKLGKAMKKLHLLIENGEGFSDEADRILNELPELRTRETNAAYRAKIKQDYQTFLSERKQVKQKIERSKRNRRKPLEEISVLQDDEYWGTRQQLRCGKIVGDMLGGLDPIFGALLNPTGGRVGPGDSAMHEVFYREEKPLAYHAASHDAFGYLLVYHDVGPGYNYLNYRWTLLDRTNPLAGQVIGLIFWMEYLGKNPVEKEF